MASQSDTLFAKTARGMGWAFSFRLASRLLGLASSVILVRILAPADFGLIALGTGIAAAVEQFGWIGVESAIVREAAPGREVYDTGFTMNLCRSLVMGVLIAAAAFPAASFFSEPRLAHVMLFLAAASAAMGAENIGVVDFRRDFAFDKEFFYLILPRILSIVLTVGTALATRSYWALVVGVVSSRLLRVLASYRMHPFRPRLSLSAWRVLIGYSAWNWGFGLVALARERADTIVIGRALNTTQVGLYSIGFDFAALTFTEFTEALKAPAFSAFAAARNDGVPLSQPLLRLLGSILIVSLPIGMGMSLVADPVIRLMVGEKWAQSIPVLQIVAAAGMATIVDVLCRNAMYASGEFGPVAWVTGIAGVLRIVALTVLIPLLGLPGAALAAGGSMVLEGLTTTAITFRRHRVPTAEAVAAVWRPACATATMALVLWAARLGWVENGAGTSPVALATQLAAGVAAGGAVYSATLLALWTAVGRPPGAEADALRVIGAALLRARRSFSTASRQRY